MRRHCLSYVFWIQILYVCAARKELALRKSLNPRNQNEFDRLSSDQCADQLDLLPDNNKPLCCGRYNSDIDRITRKQGDYIMLPARKGIPTSKSDGNETELGQFPWSIFLMATFKSDDNLSVFSCGGSLISRLYVLTAAHCVFRPGDTLVSIDITLPKNNENCDEIDRELYCEDNVMLQAEKVVHYPHFDHEKLRHDIAIIRLQQYESTRHITPVCLPFMNIDRKQLADLPLVVAGRERNGRYDIKQSTMVHLVSHATCHKFYPFLSRSHLCAAGSIWEDTRKGDSGGPLMMLFKGSYYIIGVVSGRRVNRDFGTTVPSLYTNVFHYVHWIRNNML